MYFSFFILRIISKFILRINSTHVINKDCVDLLKMFQVQLFQTLQMFSITIAKINKNIL